MSGVADDERAWWKEATVYQVYPKSFDDSDGDGVGDLPGLIDRVDYIDELDVDAVWLNPVYESPQADNGYDIADYRAIDDAYGDMSDWEQLRDELHERGVRLIMDLVVNHTSDEHEWFQRSRREVREYADYYHWVESEPDEPPNDWESVFGGPAWSWDDEREAWYLHLFDEKQPDLNWANPDVRESVYDMMAWWLSKGIDGFRMDVINLVSKAEGYPDGGPDSDGAEHFMNGPRVHEYVGEMVDEVLDDEAVLAVGETPGVSVDDARRYVGEDGDGLSLLFQFEHVTFDHGEHKFDADEPDLVEFKEILAKWQDGLADDGWNSLYLNNHDQPRMVSRFGNDEAYRRKSAKLLGTLTHTLGGTPFVYQGEEIGMTNAPFESREDLRDVEVRNYVESAVDDDDGHADSYEDVREAVEAMGRDNARTPMQWADDDHAGFTDGEPWIDANPNYTEVNVERARADPDSVLQYYRDLAALRDRDLLVYGDFELLVPDHPNLFAYTRTLARERDDESGTAANATDAPARERALVVLNFDDEPTSFEVPPDMTVDGLELALANGEVPAVPGRTLDLGPWEARVYLTPALDGSTTDATTRTDR
ncbi:alpha amylase [Halosimplex carlsbadense 2-9-1]|uniref:Alpha amylase n=1 Tax=Halosimplex carlsbadense 2-9-1 TaxID=797114 RepID=M0CJX6_9EURY|nr:alpha-glucosidase [Halosimplex carlsbadense]ELZ22672.1 alpha amylase [Halosimplex carlsbadense 2-9-1]